MMNMAFIGEYKRGGAVCYIRLTELYSHALLLALIEKECPCQVLACESLNARETQHFQGMSPYGLTPVLHSRELTVYEPSIFFDFLEERYPHPPLLPIYPVLRAKSRLMAHRIQQDWYPAFEGYTFLDRMPPLHRLQKVIEGLNHLTPLFEQHFFCSQEFSWLDITVLPLLWRFSLHKSLWAKLHTSIQAYGQRLFLRDSFAHSMGLLKQHTLFTQEAC